MKFDGTLHENPKDTIQQDFWHCTMLYDINVQVVGKDCHPIHDINVDWQGSTNYALVWQNLPVKPVIEFQHRFILAWDYASGVSENLIAPYRRGAEKPKNSKI
jgi:hypothetical protein